MRFQQLRKIMEDSQESKRRRKPNTNSLPAFEERNAPKPLNAASTKRPRRKTNPKEAEDDAPDPETSTPKAQRQKTSEGHEPDVPEEVVDLASSPQVMAPTPKKKERPFDPHTKYDKPKHFVQFIMWPIIDKKSLNSIIKSWDINSHIENVCY